jgi:hypothetical protein
MDSFHNTIAVLRVYGVRKVNSYARQNWILRNLKTSGNRIPTFLKLFQKNIIEGILILYFIFAMYSAFYWMITAWLLCTWCFS